MEQLIFEGTVSNGELSLKNLPITDGTEVEVVVFPKFKFDKASFLKMQELTKGIKGSLGDTVREDRDNRG